MRRIRYAFTMLELVMIIAVVGILAAVMIPRLNNSDTSLYNAARQIASDIRYAQHLAMVDDKIDTSADWFKARWQIYFASDSSGNLHQVYSIYSDVDKDDATNPDTTEIAVSPVAQKRMTGDSLYTGNNISQMDLTKKYGVTTVEFISGCANHQRLYFDHLGRPLLNNNSVYNDIMTSECQIKLTHSNGHFRIVKVQPETGYACVYNADTNTCK